MPTLYNKSYELIFGTPFQFTPGSFTILTTPEQRLTAIEDFFPEADPDAVSLKDHQITFDIRKTKKGSPNKSYVEIRNMSPKTLSYLSNQQGLKPAVILSAGYGGKNIEIFRGQLESYTDRKEGNERVTRLLLSDGAENTREANSVRSYRKGTPVNKIVSDLLSDMGVPKAGGGVLLDPDNIVTKKALYLSGRTSDGLDRVSRSTLGKLADWSIIDMHAYFLGEDETLPPIQVVPLSDKSGLIGSPVVKDDTAGQPTYKSTGSQTSKSNIKLRTLLNGALIPLRGITLDSKEYKGVYKIVDLRHRGSFEGSQWYSEITAEEVPDQT